MVNWLSYLIALFTLAAGVPAQCFMAHTPRNIQSPYTATDFWNQWSSVTPRQALFVKVTPTAEWRSPVTFDGLPVEILGDTLTFETTLSSIGFTSNTRDMTLPGHAGVTFKAAPGITPTMVEQILGEASSMEVTGQYLSGTFERTDVIAGKWNFAEVEIFSACWDNTSLGELVHGIYKLGEFKDYGTYFTAELRGLVSVLSRDVTIVTQRLCRVRNFGDTECGKDLTGTVTIGGTAYNIKQTSVEGNPASSIDALIFDTSTFDGNDPVDSAALALYVAYLPNGRITALDGPNAGVTREIGGAAEATGGHPFMQISLKRPFPFTIDTTTLFDITMGCDRTIENCRRWSNAANFRGEPYITGMEVANRIRSAN